MSIKPMATFPNLTFLSLNTATEFVRQLDQKIYFAALAIFTVLGFIAYKHFFTKKKEVLGPPLPIHTQTKKEMITNEKAKEIIHKTSIKSGKLQEEKIVERHFPAKSPEKEIIPEIAIQTKDNTSIETGQKKRKKVVFIIPEKLPLQQKKEEKRTSAITEEITTETKDDISIKTEQKKEKEQTNPVIEEITIETKDDASIEIKPKDEKEEIDFIVHEELVIETKDEIPVETEKEEEDQITEELGKKKYDLVIEAVNDLKKNDSFHKRRRHQRNSAKFRLTYDDFSSFA